MRLAWGRIRVFLLVALIAVLGSTVAVAQAEVENVIILIGDGMGFEHVEAGRLAAGEPLFMETAPVQTSMTTDTVNGLITDSAASGTALASGEKTAKYHVGLTPDGEPLYLITEAARDQGKAVGIVTTARITHATPAAFSAHVSSRDEEEEIAKQQLDSGFDLFLGGGATEFLPGLWDKEPALIDVAREKGYNVVQTKGDLMQAGELPLLGLFAISHMSYEAERDREKEPSLAEMTYKALQLLGRREDGFFLVVEGARIDHLGHDNRTDILPQEVRAFDAAVRVAVDFARARPGTLVIVTADHETGGLMVDESGNMKYSTTDHTSARVPLYAFGTGAGEFKAARDNTDIAKITARLAGLPLKKEVRASTAAGKTVKVMTYNIHSGKGVDLKRDLDRIVKLITDSGATIVGLNEVDQGTRRSGGVDQAAYIARELGWNYYFGANWTFDGGRFGNALVTKYPIISARNTHLPNSRGGEVRGLLQAVVEVEGLYVNVFVTHLDASFQDVRVAQARAIMDVISSVPGPKVLMGDFNATPNLSPEIATILTEFKDSYSTYKVLTDSQVALDEGFFDRDYLKGGYTYSAMDPNRRIDYIFTSFDIDVAPRPGAAGPLESKASDHLPYVAELVLPARKAEGSEVEVAALADPAAGVPQLSGKTAGILVSEANRQYYQDFRWDFEGEMELTKSTLKELGLDVIILDQLAPESLSATDILVLPNARRIEQEAIAAIRDYVGRGGRLLALGQAALEEESAEGSSGDFLLADVFGAHFISWQGVPPLHAGIKSGETTYPLGRNQAVIVEPEAGAQVLGTWVNADGTPSHQSKYNAAIVRKDGSVYVGEMLFTEENAEIPRFLELVERLLQALFGD